MHEEHLHRAARVAPLAEGIRRFVITSWAEYVRLRARMTVAERRLQVRVRQLHRSATPIRVSRLIGVSPDAADTAGDAAATDSPART